MLRAIVGVLSLGLLLTLLADVADTAPRRRAAAGRAGGAASHAAGGAPRGAISGRSMGGARLPSSSSGRLGGANIPAGPIGATGGGRSGLQGNGLPTPPQAGTAGLQGLQGGALSVRDQLPNAPQWQSQLHGVQGSLNGMAPTYGVDAGGPAPFSPAWYAQHPNAWKITHPYAGEAFVAATALGLTSFMAIESAHTGGTTVVYGSEATAEQTQAASELAESGDVTVDADGQWMPVGVFAFCPTDAPNATRMIQLAVNARGTLRGAHYDLLSEETADIIGAVDRNTTRVSWRIGEEGHVVFESDLTQLTQPQGQVRVHFPDGQTGHWVVTQWKQ